MRENNGNKEYFFKKTYDQGTYMFGNESITQILVTCRAIPNKNVFVDVRSQFITLMRKKQNKTNTSKCTK